ncbi:MAG: hypothetical protein EAY75_05845 [Bacteroidetes bacterium]|nr:MAG: hypothetical protein EAY75_05845 [Bacteroidota bacterium]
MPANAVWFASKFHPLVGMRGHCFVVARHISACFNHWKFAALPCHQPLNFPAPAWFGFAQNGSRPSFAAIFLPRFKVCVLGAT